LGIIFLPRSIDKVRATLPGGNLGQYSIAGFTHMMLEMLNISIDSFTVAIAKAEDDDAVAAFVRANTMVDERNHWNAFISTREPRGGNREEAYETYPWLRDRPDLIYALDVLAGDDVQTFK
jgi:hypothetical protein